MGGGGYGGGGYDAQGGSPFADPTPPPAPSHRSSGHHQPHHQPGQSIEAAPFNAPNDAPFDAPAPFNQHPVADHHSSAHAASHTGGHEADYSGSHSDSHSGGYSGGDQDFYSGEPSPFDENAQVIDSMPGGPGGMDPNEPRRPTFAPGRRTGPVSDHRDGGGPDTSRNTGLDSGQSPDDLDEDDLDIPV